MFSPFEREFNAKDAKDAKLKLEFYSAIFAPFALKSSIIAGMKWVKRGLIFLVVAGFAMAMFKPFCNALFHCGCEGLWAAGGQYCNVHTKGVPHCPFCATGNWGKSLPTAAILISQALVVFVPKKLSSLSRIGLGIFAFLVVGIAIGFLFQLQTHYPTFL